MLTERTEGGRIFMTLNRQAYVIFTYQDDFVTLYLLTNLKIIEGADRDGTLRIGAGLAGAGRYRTEIKYFILRVDLNVHSKRRRTK